MRSVEIRYKCSCFTSEVALRLEERRDDEDVVDFMVRVQDACGDDHFNRSPLCMATEMEYVKVPIIDDKIGGGLDG